MKTFTYKITFRKAPGVERDMSVTAPNLLTALTAVYSDEIIAVELVGEAFVCTHNIMDDPEQVLKNLSAFLKQEAAK